jgi:hypothetical protein
MLEDAMTQDSFSGPGFGEGHSVCMRCQKKLYGERSRKIGLGPKCERIVALQEQLEQENEWGQLLMFLTRREAAWDTTNKSSQV